MVVAGQVGLFRFFLMCMKFLFFFVRINIYAGSYSDENSRYDEI